MSTSQVWLITGATSGIGLELARAALAAGRTVIAGCRSKSKDPDLTSELEKLGVTWLELDAGANDVESKVKGSVTQFGRIDVLVNNAGYSVAGAIEDISVQQSNDLFNVNFNGPLRTIQAILPSMRAQKSGTIVNISSSIGIGAYPGLSVYSASKFALEGLTEGLQMELAPFNIRVLLVEPGMIGTRFGDPKGSGLVVPFSEAYQNTPASQTVDSIMAAYAAGMGSSAEKTALRIVEAVDGTGLLQGREVKLRLPLGADASKAIAAKGQAYVDLVKEQEDVAGSI